MITLFSIDAPQPTKRPSAFAVSLLLHCVVLVVVVVGFNYSQAGLAKRPVARYPVQFIRLHLFDPVVPNRISDRSRDSVSERRSFRVPQPPRVRTARQTLIRMDVPPDVLLKQELPIPPALLWTSPLASAARFISPPKEIPEPVQNLTRAPRLDLPNREIKLADLQIAEAALTSTPALAVPTSVALPVQISASEQGKQIPQTTSPEAEQASAASIISIPDIPLRALSLIAIPPANQIAVQDAGAGFQRAQDTPSRPGSPSEGPIHSGDPGSNSDAAVQNDETPGMTRITLPKDGKFGVVVMGSSASELYPDSAGVLSGSIVYTVYLHLGLQKNWILQYCLPKGSEPDGTAPGNAAIDAPWPWLILRPDQLSALDFDYIIVRGNISPRGRFEQAALVYPNELPEQERLLGAIRHWGFRPAMRGSQAIAVEALLIIPRQGE